MQKIKHTGSKYKETLQQPTDPRLQEDHQFLEKPRKGAKMVIGKLNVKLLKRNNRKASKEARLPNQSIKVDEHDGILSLPSSTDADADDDGDEFTSSAVVKNDNKKGIGECKS